MAVFVAILSIYTLLVLLIVSMIFVLAQILKDNSIMDIAYGPVYALATIGTMLITQSKAVLPFLIAVCVALWASRLFVRIFRKNFGKPEDERYAKWRSEWTSRGRRYFFIRSYAQIYLLQGLVIIVVSLPIIISIAAGDALWLPVVALGLMVYCIGLAYETIADMQLDEFLKRKREGKESAAIMTSGLFKLSRRPNYFGETLVWWGLALMVVSLPFGWLGLLSPFLITFIVAKVTGPLLEDQFLSRYPEAYGQYMATTNYFIPGPPKTS